MRGTVVVWDAETGRPVHTLRGHKHLVRQLAFLADGRLLGSSSLDGTVQVHEAATGRMVRKLEVGKPIPAGQGSSARIGPGCWRRRPTAAGWRPTPTTTRSRSGTSPRGRIAPSSRADPHGYMGALFSPDGRWLATLSGYDWGGGAGYPRVWNVATGAEAVRLDQHDQAAASHWPSAPILAPWRAVRHAGLILLWNLADGRLRKTLTGHEGPVLGLAFSPDGLQLASVSRDRTVRSWEIESGVSTRVIRGHTDIVTSLAFSPDGDRLVTGSQDATARVWDLTLDEETGDAAFAWAWKDGGPTEAIAYSRQGRELVSYRRDGVIERHESGSFGKVGEILYFSGVPWLTPAELAAFDPEGRRLVRIHYSDPTVALYRGFDGGWESWLHGHTMPIRFATLSADGARVATAAVSDPPGSRTEIIVWDGTSERILHRRESVDEAVDRVALDPAADDWPSPRPGPSRRPTWPVRDRPHSWRSSRSIPAAS